jgi:hypothetical protein
MDAIEKERYEPMCNPLAPQARRDFGDFVEYEAAIADASGLNKKVTGFSGEKDAKENTAQSSVGSDRCD